MSHGARSQQFAAASRFWSIPNLRPRSTVAHVWLTEWARLGQLCGALTSDNLFFLSFRECCLTRQWQRTECDKRYVVQRKKFDVILRFLGDRYRRTKPPKPDASQVVVPWPARLPKSEIGSGGLSSSQFDDDVPEINCTSTGCRRSRGESRKLRFGSNRTAPKIWQEGQHDLHSPPQPIDWREHTIGAVHDRNLPTRSIQVPESYENFPWHRVKVRSIVTGLRCDDEIWMTIAVIVVSASCHHLTRADSGWKRISWFSRGTLPWLRGGTSVAPWGHKCSHVPVFRGLFDRFPVRISTSDLRHRILRKKTHIISELMILECSFHADPDSTFSVKFLSFCPILQQWGFALSYSQENCSPN